MRRQVMATAAVLFCGAIMCNVVSAEEAKPAATKPAEQAAAAKPAATTTAQRPSIVQSMLQRNNEIRASRGMRPLRISSRLTAAAQNHARYMASTGSFSHYSNGGPSGRAATYGYRSGVRENIAMGQGNVQSAFSTWTASSGHYTNMMSNSAVAGFGYAVGRNGQPYWVAVYGPDDGVRETTAESAGTTPENKVDNRVELKN